MKLILFFLFAVISSNVFACDCKTISKEMDYEQSDYVFLGQVTNIYGAYFELHVQEMFKGKNVNSFKVVTTDECSIHPKRGEVWLMYSKKAKDTEIHVSHCGWSRSFENPFSINSDNFPSPPMVGEQINSTTNIKEALYELEHDILNLRNIKNLENKAFEIQEFYPAIILVCIFVIVGMLIYVFRLN